MPREAGSIPPGSSEQFVQHREEQQLPLVDFRDAVSIEKSRPVDGVEFTERVPEYRQILIPVGQAETTDVDASRDFGASDQEVVEREVAVGDDQVALDRQEFLKCIPDPLRRPARSLVVEVLPGAAPVAELVAEDLRLAARALGRLTGRVDVEDLLDVIFRDFCIGK